MADLVVKSKVKEVVKEKNFRLSGKALDKLSEVVQWHLNKAMERAEANGRKTIKSADL